MNKDSAFGVIGGDIRFIRVAQRLSEAGNRVFAAGLGDDLKETEQIKICSPKDVVQNARYIILPLPASTDGVNINSPEGKAEIPIESVFSMVSPEQTVFCGKAGSIAGIAKQYGVTLIDYLEREDMAIQNAVPTAEGAVFLAMQEMSKTVYHCNCLITGYGRIAKILSAYMKALGAYVTVAARSLSDLTWAEIQGYSAVHIKDVPLKPFDVIFNTVPSRVFDAERLSSANKSSVIIDLASKPGGIDFTAAKELGLNVIWALSLPGKVAPISAGDIICKTIMTIISERSVNRE